MVKRIRSRSTLLWAFTLILLRPGRQGRFFQAVAPAVQELVALVQEVES